MTTKVGIVGAAGRMGQELIRAAAEHAGTSVHAALERAGADAIGRDAGVIAGLEALGVTLTDDPSALAGCDAIVDFTAPAATLAFAEIAAAHGIAHVIGTTGMSDDDGEQLRQAAQKTVIVKSGNMSMGVILMAELVKQAAAALDAGGWDVEILEMHHKHKVDAPSGTALLLGEAAAEGRQIALADHSVRTRDGHTGARDDGSIGFATLRGGSVVGEHSVIFAGTGETVTLTHKAGDRAIFARGAIQAAIWAHSKKDRPGLYSMRDVLGIA